MIIELTEGQKKQLIDHREEAFGIATGTTTSREKAEELALKLAGSTLGLSPDIHWETSLYKASASHHKMLLESLMQEDSIFNELWYEDTIFNELWHEPIARMKAGCRDGISTKVSGLITANINHRLTARLWNSLVDRLGDNRWRSLIGYYKYDIPLGYKVHKNGKCDFADSFPGTLVASLIDTGIISFYSFAEKIGIEFSEEDSLRIKRFMEIQKYCFAMYILPGCITLVDRPTSVDIKHGNLCGIEFG